MNLLAAKTHFLQILAGVADHVAPTANIKAGIFPAGTVAVKLLINGVHVAPAAPGHVFTGKGRVIVKLIQRFFQFPHFVGIE